VSRPPVRSRLYSFTVITVLLLIGLTTLSITPAYAFGWNGGGIIPKSGYITTRGLVVDEATGAPSTRKSWPTASTAPPLARQ